MHFLHSCFSVLVGPYNLEQRLFGCWRELPLEGLSSISDILVYSFAVRRVGRAVLREDHIVHVEVVSPSHWRTRPCNRASGKAEGRDLACWGLTFLPPDTAARLFDYSTNIVEDSQLLSPLLTG